MKNIKKYLKVLLQIISMSNSSAAIYRVDYVLRIIRAILEIAVAFVIISSFYFKADTIANWTRWEALLVYAIFQIVSTFIFIFAGYGITSLSQDIVRGNLDRFLTKPLDSQFLSCIRITYITNIFRLLFGLFLLTYVLIQLQLNFSFLNISLTIIAMISSIIIYYCFTFSVAALAFWTFTGEFTDLMSTITSISRFPSDFFSKGIKIMIHIIPLVFISTIPAQALLGKNFILALFSPLIAIVMFYLTRKLWLLGLKSYQSASS